MFTYKAEVVKIVDGDTIDVDIDLGFKTWSRNIRLRLNRIDAYETRLYKGTTEEEKQKGLLAKAEVESMCLKAPDKVVIKTTKQGKYGRWIAEVIIDGENLSDKLVELGYAVYREY
jgi:micrococcal nuclease